MSKRIRLQTQSWHYTCGDGCCDDYGEKLFVNGKELDGADLYANAHDALEKVLEHLGYEIDWDEELDEDRIDMRMDIEEEEE